MSNKRERARADLQRTGHLLNGNCFAVLRPCLDGCGRDVACGFCHKHEERRGKCSECRACFACSTDGKET